MLFASQKSHTLSPGSLTQLNSQAKSTIQGEKVEYDPENPGFAKSRVLPQVTQSASRQSLYDSYHSDNVFKTNQRLDSDSELLESEQPSVSYMDKTQKLQFGHTGLVTKQPYVPITLSDSKPVLVQQAQEIL